jgi:hypothetical protein
MISHVVKQPVLLFWMRLSTVDLLVLFSFPGETPVQCCLVFIPLEFSSSSRPSPPIHPQLPQLLFAIANKIINPWVGVTQQVEGERLVVREDGKRAAIQDVVKVSDAKVAGEKFLSKADCLTRPSLASLKRSQGK